MAIIRLICAAVVLLAVSGSPANAGPFEQLRAAYAARDAGAATLAYGPDAEVVYRYAGVPEERHRGRAAIEASFAALFAQLDPAVAPDLNFRTVRQEGNRLSGFYRLRLGAGITSYGTFEVELSADGLFARDVSSDAAITDFEGAAGAVMLGAADETLERTYYGRMAGRYRLTEACDLVVTQSVVRLFARDTCTQMWRGLARESGLQWTAGHRVLPDEPAVSYAFVGRGEGAGGKVTIKDGADGVTADRIDRYHVEPVSFAAGDGVRLAGDLYIPTGPLQPRPAMVLVHGSGPQDRNGYASIIGVLADSLAAGGRVVLTYDKRGTGGSGGDWTHAGFEVLADDAVAAMAWLSERPEVDPARIGLGGSSQAGWVAAVAIKRGAEPADVFLLGAAGIAMTVAEQNLYNTEARMRCSGLPEQSVNLVLDQQRAFFAFLRDRRAGAALDALTRRAATDPALADWLMPDSRVDLTAGDWFSVLDVDFDPLPVWRAYRGHLVTVFSDRDDSTPTSLAAARIADRAPSVVLTDTQHLGLVTTDICKGELADLDRFNPELFQQLEAFARRGATAAP